MTYEADDSLEAQNAHLRGHIARLERQLAAQQNTPDDALLQRLVAHLPGMVFRCRAGDRRRLEFVSAGCRTLTGYSSAELIEATAVTLADLVHPDDKQQVQAVARFINSKPTDYTLRYRIRAACGREKWVQEWGQLIVSPAGELLALEGFLQDVSAYQATEQALHESEFRFRQVAENLEVVFWLASPDEQELLYISPSYERVWCQSCAALYDDPTAFFEAIHPEDRVLWYEQDWHDPAREVELEYRLLRPDGTLRWIACRTIPLIDEQGSVVHRLGMAHDITERKVHETRIEHLAFTDPLTGLPNRRRLYEVGDMSLAAGAEVSHITLLYLDLDRFKAFNDTMGHDAGDELLTFVTERLRNCIPNHDVLARIGGDEFAVLLLDYDQTQATALARIMLENIEQPFAVRSQQVYLAGSIGIASAEPGELSFSKLLTRADIAMYRAKQLGSGIQVYNPQIVTISPDQLQLESDLHRALNDNELTLYYQPVLNLETNQIMGVEALVRWQHPTRGLLMPDTFLPVAEEIGLLRALDSWVLRSAVQQTAAWNVAGQTFDVAINLTVYSLQDPALIGEVEALLTRTGVPPQHIVIELTEHSALRDPETVQKVLHGLRDLGLRVALDDFGSGYASLANLQQIPVDILKVDRAFTAGIEREPRDEAVVMALLALGRGMHIGVVVEGVEDDAQLIWLRQAGCSQAQGYWIGRPVPANLIVGRDMQQG